MSKGLFLRVAGVAAIMAVAAQGQAANLLTNGSFEQPDIGTEIYLGAGSSFMPGWTVALLPGTTPGTQIALQDNAAYGALGVVASNGTQLLDLTGVVGRGGGVVSTAFATQAGAAYMVAFDVGAFLVAGQGSFGDATVDLYVDGLFAQSFTNIMSLTTVGSDWERFSYGFTGTGSGMTIGLFASLSTTSSNLGVGLDNVMVEQVGAPAVPEPASWAMMIGGLGLAGMALRRRPGRIAFA